jgi:hypothetical protein
MLGKTLKRFRYQTEKSQSMISQQAGKDRIKMDQIKMKAIHTSLTWTLKVMKANIILEFMDLAKNTRMMKRNLVNMNILQLACNHHNERFKSKFYQKEI